MRMRVVVSLIKQESKEEELMEKEVKEDEVSFRQAEYQLVRLRIVLTANGRKLNKDWFLEIGCVFLDNKKAEGRQLLIYSEAEQSQNRSVYFSWPFLLGLQYGCHRPRL